MERWDMPHSSSRLTLAMTPLRLAVLASGSGSNFQALVEALRDEPRLQVVLLIVNRPGAAPRNGPNNWGFPVS